MLAIPPGFVHVAIEHVADGDPDPWYVTFGVDISDDEGDVPDIVGTIIAAYRNSIGSQIWSGVNITGAQVAVGTEFEEPLRMFVNNPGTVAGGQSGTFLPQNCALLVKKNTAVGGRRNQGRMFIPSIVSEGACNNVGQIDSGALNTYQTQATAFLNVINDPLTNMQMVILHNDPPGELGPTPVTSLTVSNTISTQRRRLR